MFIGREQELKFLESRYQSNQGELIVMYGRRRVGKTELLKKFCENKQHIFFSCTETTNSKQLRSFSEEILKIHPFSKFMKQFSDWESLFQSLAAFDFTLKPIIVIDEFPYMCKGDSSIPSIIQKIWDSTLKDKNMMLILCGSAMSFMENEILAEKNPLYGRATGVMKVEPMSFYDARDFVPQLNFEEQLEVYAMLGGIPHYLKMFSPLKTLKENVIDAILTPGAVLFSETDFMIRQELREISVYNSIIETIAAGSSKLSEISSRSLIDNNAKTATYLKNLIKLGLVERELSVDAGLKERTNQNRGIYKITDAFFRFWYTFVFPQYSIVAMGDTNGFYDYQILPMLHQYASSTFEQVCKEYLIRRQIRNEVPFRFAKIGRWMGKTTLRDKNKKNEIRIDETEIAILAYNTERTKYIVGECKFKNQPFTYIEYLDTKMKLSDHQVSADFYYVLFSLSGFEDSLLEEAKHNDKLILVSNEELAKG